MPRLCIIGDSHVAALKQGWDTIQGEYPSLDVAVFAGISRTMKDFKVKEGKLVACSEALRRQLRRFSSGGTEVTGDYDAFICTALGADLRLALLETLRAADAASPPKERQRIFRRAIRKLLRRSEAHQFMSRLRKITEAPLLLIGRPYPHAETMVEWKALPPAEQQGLTEIYAQIFDRVLTKSCGARFLRQPVETLDPHCPLATSLHFFRKPARVDPKLDGLDDGAHANADYGAIVLKAALRALGLG